MENLVSRSFSGAKWQSGAAILQKIITFTLNQALISRTSPEVYGLAAIQLELLLSTLLFLSREGIRLACLREDVENRLQMQNLVNISYIPSFFLSVVIALIFIKEFLAHSWISSYFYSMSTSGSGASDSVATSPEIDLTVVLMYCIGALLESLGEPLLNVYQNSLQLGPRLRAETVAVFAKCLVTFFTVGYLDWGIQGFGMAQIAYGASHVLTLIISARSVPVNGRRFNIVDYLPRRLSEEIETESINNPSTVNVIDKESSKNRKIRDKVTNQITDKKDKNQSNEKEGKSDRDSDRDSVILNMFKENTCKVAFTTSTSSLIKHLLTEADKITLSLFTSRYDQGIFALANNYASLIARMLFLPIEESARMAFSKLATDIRKEDQVLTTKRDPTVVADAKVQVKSKALKDRKVSVGIDNMNKEHEEAFARNFESLATLITFLLRVVMTVGLIFPTFGPHYARVVVNIAMNRRWRSEETVVTLQIFCFYLYTLAINGVSEAFVHSVAPSTAFGRINFNMTLSTIAYLICAVLLVPTRGTSGIVLAGSVSMLCRSLGSFMYIRDCFASTTASTSINLHGETVKRVFDKDNQSKFNFTRVFPSFFVLVTAISISVALFFSSRRYANSANTLRDAFEHVIIGAVLGIIFLGTMYRELKQDFVKARTLFKGVKSS